MSQHNQGQVLADLTHGPLRPKLPAKAYHGGLPKELYNGGQLGWLVCNSQTKYAKLELMVEDNE